jgi:hypothetical protein
MAVVADASLAPRARSVCTVLFATFHPAYVWGRALIFIMFIIVPVRLALSGTAACHSLASFLVQ